jgi:hypothetical protein
LHEGTNFASEHVIPVAFGKFKKNLTLHSVCGACNHYFSKNLELHFNRDSREGITRFKHALRSSPARPSARLSARCEEEVAKGARFSIVPTTDIRETVHKYDPQVCFFRENSDENVWLFESALNAENLSKLQNYTFIKFLTKSREEGERMEVRLQDLGCQLGPIIDEQDVLPGELKRVRITAQYDTRIADASRKSHSTILLGQFLI